MTDPSAGPPTAADTGGALPRKPRKVFLLVGVVVAAAWIGFGRKTIRLRQLVFIPLYLVGKIPLYLALIFRGRQRKWERTTRKGESPE